MRTIYFAFFLILISTSAIAQTCKIKVYYDDNGNRIKRELDCTGLRPANNDETSEMLTMKQSAIDENNDASEFSIKAFPNPSSDVLTIVIAGTMHASDKITLSDQLGRVHLTQAVTGRTFKISMAKFSDGVYYLKYKGINHENVIKIVKFENTNIQ